MAQGLKVRQASVGYFSLAECKQFEMRQPAEFRKTCIRNRRFVDYAVLQVP